MKRLALCLVLLWSAPAWCQSPSSQAMQKARAVAQAPKPKGDDPTAPTLTLPAKVEGRANKFIRVTATTNCKDVKWYVIDGGDTGLDLYPPEEQKNTLTAVVIGSTPGTYRILAYAAMGDQATDPAICNVVIKSPTPPPPPPPPPPPDDPLFKDVQSAFSADADDGKGDLKAALAGLYTEAAKSVKDPGFATWGDFFDSLSASAKSRGITGHLLGVQGVTQRELRRVLPKDRTATMDEAGRAAASVLFARLARLLEAVK